MKSIIILGSLLMGFFTPAFGECVDTEFTIVENMSDPLKAGRTGTMLVQCHGGQLQIPEITSLHFIWQTGDQLQFLLI